MNRTLRHISLALIIFLCSTLPAVRSFAQANKNDTTSYVDTVATADTGTLSNPEEVEPSNSLTSDSSTLFFVGKADSTMMYDTTSVVVRTVPDSIGKRLKSDGDFWYANKAQEKKKEENNESFWDKFWNRLDRLISKMFFRSVIWIVLILIFIGIIIWLLIQNNISLFSGKIATVAKSEGEPELTDINLIEFPVEISKAEQNNDLRLATRLRFLQLLKVLSDNNRIVYGPDKTNMDYLMQLFNTNLYEDFFRVTRNYEYVWYGNFELNATKFGIIQNEFEKLNQRLA